MTERPARRRGVVLLGLAGAAMLAGLWGGLARLGYAVPAAGTAADEHGMLMALGFLGTMIAVERAVALGRAWGWTAPLAGGLATGVLLGAPGAVAGRAMLPLAGLLLTAVYVAIHRRQPSLHNTLMGGSAIAWCVAAALWAAGFDIARLVPWLALFLVGTIAAERLELSRVAGATRAARGQLAAGIAGLGVAAVVSVWLPGVGVRLGGLALLAIAGWLAVLDVARRTIRMDGVTRFIAAGLLAGYVWLAVAGVLWLVGGAQDDSPCYDAQLHALFLGFVMSMVFSHAPVIAPAVLRRPMRYRPRFYVHLGLLHASLLLRLVGGDLLGSTVAWQVGGVANEVALLAFVASTVAGLYQSRADRGSAGSASSSGPGGPGRRAVSVPESVPESVLESVPESVSEAAPRG